MIGQTMINVKASKARTRISTFAAGIFLLALVVGLGDVVARIPMAALVAVMIMVSVGTMDWHSVSPRTLKQMPGSATTIMAVTVAVTILTHNLAYGVIPACSSRPCSSPAVSPTSVTSSRSPGSTTTRACTQCAACCSSRRATTVYQFDYVNDPTNVIIDLTDAQIYDSSTVAALDAIVLKYHHKGKHVEIVGIDEHSARWHALSGTLSNL